jgi:hypothetical protein
MSQQEPTRVYVLQPTSAPDVCRIGGLPSDLTREEAEAVVEAINGICWLMEECDVCGHVLRFPSSDCPQCGASAIASWFSPRGGKECLCPRCQQRGPR